MENIKVLVRVRPLNYRETHLGANACVTTSENSVILDNKKEYNYDHVLGVESSQQEVFEKIGHDTLESLIHGLNCCIFAYGQTGAGKTYTMQGKGFDDMLQDEVHLGLQPRLIQQLFKTLPKDNWVMRCTYLEIYNEQLIDLLNDAKPMTLTIREDAKRVYVENLTEVAASSYQEVLSLMQRGLSNRHVSATQMNLESSRSHSIFTIQLEQRMKGMYTRKSKLNFVDLAGSERQKLTAATGDRLKEAANINKSLTVLGVVINSLAENPKKFIPYRDSKLTFLLRESLGGNSKTIMIATVSAASSSFQETLGTLKFASRAKNIKNQAIVNEEIGGSLESLKAEIKRLKNELNQSTQSELLPKKQKEIELVSQISALSCQLNESSLYQEQLSRELNQMKDYYESRITEMVVHNEKNQEFSKTGLLDKDQQLQQSLEIQRDLRHKNEILNQRILELQQEDTILKHRRNEQQMIIAQLEQSLSDVKNDLEQVNQEFHQQLKQIEQYEQQIETLQEDRSIQCQELENKISELSDQLQLNKDQLDTDQQTIEFQTDEIERLQKEYEISQIQLEQFQKDCTQFKEEIKEKAIQIQNQRDEINQIKRLNAVKSKKFLKSLKIMKKQQERYLRLENEQNQLLEGIKQEMQLEDPEISPSDIPTLLKLKFSNIEGELSEIKEYSEELTKERDQYLNLYQVTKNNLHETVVQNQALSDELEKKLIDQEALQKYEQLKDEFKYQKDKLSKFLDSFDIINQKLIMKENEVLKLRSSLKLEQTQRAKCLEEIDKYKNNIFRLRTQKIEISNHKQELEQTLQQLQCNLLNESDEIKQKKLSENVSALQKANQKLNIDLATLQRQHKQLQDEKEIMQKKYEEKLMYSLDINRLRKDINITNQIKEDLYKKEKDYLQLLQETQLLEDFFKKNNVKRFCNYQIQSEGTISEKVKSYFEFLEVFLNYIQQCEQEFEFKQFQLKTNQQLLQIEQADCHLIKEENRMLKMQLKM